MSGDDVVRVHILGRVSAWRADAPITLGPSGRRAVLGLLALAGGRPVSRGEFIDSLWAERPPPSAANVIQTHVARLRRLLEPGRPAHTHSALLPAVGDGYALQVPPASIDLVEFRHLVAAATDPTRPADPRRTAELLAGALQLWQEPPLADLPALANHPKVVALAAERRAALARYGDAMMAAGAAADAVPILEEAAATDPLDEPGLARLIRAYHAAGLRGRAVEFYGRARRRLAEELGLSPGPELTAAHAALIAENPVAVATRAARPAPASTVDSVAPGDAVRPAPAQLPADVPDFVGRGAELAELSRLRTATAGATLVLAGTAGVGKTGLALHWAHRARAGFPDGQLYVDLRGYDPEQPMPAGDALAGFLRALGMRGADIPADPAERAAAYRTLLDGRRVLVLLDNAGSVEQVRPLLPGTPSCLVLVTSRDSLAGLVARHGARRLDLDQLPLAEATALLRTLIGSRVDADPDAVATLAGQCARLPLALRIAAELAAARPDTPLAGLVAELTDQRRRLDLLDAAGDPRAAVRAVFSWSYQCLPADAARAFRLLGLHPGADYDAPAAAALTSSPPSARRALDVLARAHLVHPTGAGRYGMHDLLRAYALELAQAADAAPDRRAALTRLFDHYLTGAATAMDTLVPGEQYRRPRVRPTDGPARLPTDRAAARAWLDAERATLVAVIDHAADHGWPEHASRLAATLFRYFDIAPDLTTGLAIHTRGLDAAGRTSDQSDAARALGDLGVVHARQGRFDAAAAHFEQALAAYRAAGDITGQARCLGNLGNVYQLTGRFAPAADCLQQAVALHGQAGNVLGEAYAQHNLGELYCRQGRYEQAAERYEEALTAHRSAGNPDFEGYALNGLGECHSGRGDYERAGQHHRQALARFQDSGNRDGLACSLTSLGDVSLWQGCPGPAADLHQRALDRFREAGNLGGEARAHNGLGAALLAAGRPDVARAHFTDALALAERTGERYHLAQAHRGLADTAHLIDDHDRAAAHERQAAALFADLGMTAHQAGREV